MGNDIFVPLPVKRLKFYRLFVCSYVLVKKDLSKGG